MAFHNFNANLVTGVASVPDEMKWDFAYIPACKATHTQSNAHTCLKIKLQGSGTKKIFLKSEGFQGIIFKRIGRGKMTVWNRELVPDSWSLVREKERWPLPLVFVWKNGILNTGHLQMRSCWEWKAIVYSPAFENSNNQSKMLSVFWQAQEVHHFETKSHEYKRTCHRLVLQFWVVLLLVVVDKWRMLLICAFVLCVADRQGLRYCGRKALTRWTADTLNCQKSLPCCSGCHLSPLLYFGWCFYWGHDDPCASAEVRVYWAIQAGLLTPLTFAWHCLSPLAAFTSSAYFLHSGRRWQWICTFYTANFRGL